MTGLSLNVMKTVILILGVLSTLSTPWVHANVTPEQRTLFQTAYAAAQQGRFEEVNTYSASLKNYPLFPWLEYEYLKQNLNTVSGESILAFTSRYPNSVMSDELFERWSNRLAADANWTGILELIPSDHPSDSLQCYRALALGKAGNSEQSIQLATKLIATKQGGLPAPCTEVLGILTQHNVLSDYQHWKRIEQAMEENQVSFAQAVAKLLPLDKQLLVERYRSAARSCHRTTQTIH